MEQILLTLFRMVAILPSLFKDSWFPPHLETNCFLARGGDLGKNPQCIRLLWSGNSRNTTAKTVVAPVGYFKLQKELTAFIKDIKK